MMMQRQGLIADSPSRIERGWQGAGGIVRRLPPD